MIRLIVGVKGTGKTKMLIDAVNIASKESHGAVVCIEYGRKLTFDIKYQARLVDAKDYEINSGETLFGFVCGVLAANYDVTELFIDSALKICNDDIDSFKNFIIKTNEITTKNKVNCFITASMAHSSVPQELKELLTEF